MEDVETNIETCYQKLEKIKTIRQKTLQLEKLKLAVKEASQDAEEEMKSLETYKSELGNLLQEKMAHVEELRLIHTDINTMESLIKQSSADRNNILNEGQKLLQQYRPLKQQVDLLRMEIGLQKNSEFLDEEPKISAEILSGRKLTLSNTSDKAMSSEQMPHSMEQQDNFQLVLPNNDVKQTSQPPPMKACLSCHQQIHRNAPICPLCKAKSRSRNPKKPKKVKQEE